MKSALNIDYILQGYFKNELETNGKYDELLQKMNHYDFQDTDCNNETECYFYFPNTIEDDLLERCKTAIADILGLENGYPFMTEDQTDDGNPEIRVCAICSISTIADDKTKNDSKPNEDGETFKVVETAEVKRVYFVKAVDGEDAIDKVYSGDFEPELEEEDGNELTVYDEDGNAVEC